MRALGLGAEIRRTPEAVWRTFGQETAVILPEASAVRTLNEVGTRVWELADGRTLGELLEILLKEFDVPRYTLEADVRAFLIELEARNLLIIQDVSGGER